MKKHFPKWFPSLFLAGLAALCLGAVAVGPTSLFRYKEWKDNAAVGYVWACNDPNIAANWQPPGSLISGFLNLYITNSLTSSNINVNYLNVSNAWTFFVTPEKFYKLIPGGDGETLVWSNASGINQQYSNNATIFWGPLSSRLVPLAYDTTNVHLTATGMYYRLVVTNNFGLTLTGGYVDRQTIDVEYLIGGVGQYTFVPTNGFVKFGTDITGAALSTNQGLTDYMKLRWNLASNRWDCIGFLRGY